MEAVNGRHHEAFDVLEGVKHNIEFTLGQLRNSNVSYETKVDYAQVSDKILQEGNRVKLVPIEETSTITPSADNIFSQGELQLAAFYCRPDREEILLICFPDGDPQQTMELLASQLPLSSSFQVEVEERFVASIPQQFRDRYNGHGH